MKTLVVLQPGYLPWLGFFDQMRRADVFVYYDDVQYDKHGWRNRNRVKGPDGPQWLTVPVRNHGLGRPRIMDAAIDARAPWARKHLATLRQLYAKAPHVKRYLPELEEALMRPWERIVDLDLTVVALMAKWLGLAPAVSCSSELQIDGEQSIRLLRICQHFGATRYLSGSAARDYLDVALFAQHGVEVAWQDYRHPEYPQQHGGFVPYLSAIDLLLNCGDDSRAILESGNPQ
ncbi:MAG: WbqC family protein [Vicinamibacterales bacterium]